MATDWDKLDKEREANARLAETHAIPLYRPARPMGVAVARALRPILKEAGPAPETLQSRWSEIVGPRIAAISQPVRVSRGKDGGVLHLRAPSAAAPILQHARDHIIERVNLASGSKITRLQIVQTAPPKRPVVITPTPLTPEQREALFQRLAPFRANPLRNALAELGEAVLTGRRKG